MPADAASVAGVERRTAVAMRVAVVATAAAVAATLGADELGVAAATFGVVLAFVAGLGSAWST